MNNDKAKEVQLALTAQTVEDMRGDKPLQWTKTWTEAMGVDGLAYNGTTGKRYRGGNIFWLALAAWQAGYESSAWGTFKQWKAIGAHPRKGEHGTVAIFWKLLKRTATVDTPDGPQEVEKNIPMLRHFTVFNFDQLEIEDQELFDSRAKVTKVVVDPDATYPGEAWFEAIGAVMVVGSPSWSPSKDVIAMPALASFDSPEEYATTKAHEHGHWTGHKDRLNRPKHTKWGDDAYAYEELVAELTAVLFAGHFGLEHVTQENHRAYLAHWASQLTEDPGALWTAATKASAAFEFLAEFSDDGEDAAEEDSKELVLV